MFISRFSFLVIFRVLLVLSLFPPQHLLCYCASPCSLSCLVRCVKFCLSLSISQSCLGPHVFACWPAMSPCLSHSTCCLCFSEDRLLARMNMIYCWINWSLDAGGGDEGVLNGAWVMRGGDGDVLDCTTASAKEKNRCTVRFKVCAMNADWPGKGWRRWLD